MKAVEVKDQVRLPLSKCLELVLSGVKYRLFRASITVAIIALATAFLMTMLTEGLTARTVADAIDAQLAGRETFRFWLSHVSVPVTERQLTAQLASMQPGDQRWQEESCWMISPT